MGKRATRKAKAGDGIRDLEVDALKAENLHLKEEIERLRLRNAGAHPAAALADALQSADDAGDSADDALTMYASSMVIRSELIELLALFKSTIQDYERRLEMLTDTPAAVEVSRDQDEADDEEIDEIDLTVTEDESDEDDLEIDEDELVAEADDEDDDQDDNELVAEADDEDDDQDDDELVAAADDTQDDDEKDEDEQPDAVTIDLRDKGRKKDKVTAVNGSRRKGGNRGRSRDEDTAPAAKGA